MTSATSLQRFLDAQATDYAQALAEIQNGRKRGHWMWYIFPQIQGLGFSETSRYYALKDLAEAEAYLAHPVLGNRLVRISQALLGLASPDATRLLGSPDNVKLKSSMTLFAVLPATNPVFQAVLAKFFGGIKDAQTLRLVNQPTL